MIYESETWSPKKAEENMLLTEKRWRVLGVSLRNHVDNLTLRQMSSVNYMVMATRESEILLRYTLL